MGPEDFGLDHQLDFARAWKQKDPFLYLKNIMYETIYKDEGFKYDYPYDAIFNQVCAIGFIKEAHKEDELIEIRYGWEPLDSSNVMMHSCQGLVVHASIIIDAKDTGFLLELGEEEDLQVAAFRYKDIFWVAPIRD